MASDTHFVPVHPIPPPPELVQQWAQLPDDWNAVAFHIAQWGADQANADIEHKLQKAADQELEACRHWLEVNGAPRKFIDGLLVARCCSEPPSLKERSLKHLEVMERDRHYLPEILQDLRRAVEQLND